MRVAALMLLLASAAEALDVGVEPYRESRRAGALGAVAGRVAAEPRMPQGAPLPFTGTTITLLPRSEALLGRLERLRQGARESSEAFTGAAPAMRKAREAYERELSQAGASDLARTMRVGPDGGFKIEEVPAGAWLLLAWHSAPVGLDSAKPKPKPRQRDQRDLYLPQSRLEGYEDVTLWLRELTVTGGGTATVELTDRNGWFRGVVEKRVLGPGR